MEQLYIAFTIAFSVISMGIFIGAIKKIWHGFTSWRSGEQDVTELIGGLLMVTVPFIVYGVYSYFGISDGAISPHDIKALKDFK